MSAALEAARTNYSEWFYPFPWERLKLSEFPAFAGYAQGFPTNITFSEGIGFLTKSDPRSHAAFAIVAHEAAHQWWGNLLTPGRGPGGNMLSEGMSHYATILLHEEVHGDRHRIEFHETDRGTATATTVSWTPNGHSSKPTARAGATGRSFTTRADG